MNGGLGDLDQKREGGFSIGHLYELGAAACHPHASFSCRQALDSRVVPLLGNFTAGEPRDESLNTTAALGKSSRWRGVTRGSYE